VRYPLRVPPPAAHPRRSPACPPAAKDEALRIVISKALIVDGVRRGLHESLKALAKGDRDSTGKVAANGARLAILATDCEEAAYKKVVKALAQEKGTPLIEIGKAETLGEWCVPHIPARLPRILPSSSPPPPLILPTPPPPPFPPPPPPLRCGLCKLDKDGKPRKVVSTSCAVITDFGEISSELAVLGINA
jgi:small subunit ribosomal protein S12e